MTCQHVFFGVDQPCHTGGGLHLQATLAGAERPTQEEMQALGTNVAEGDGLGSQSWLIRLTIKTPPCDGVNVLLGY